MIRIVLVSATMLAGLSKRCSQVHLFREKSSHSFSLLECGLPVNLTKGSFEKVHATLHTVMDSFKIICTTLAQAEPDWWKYSDENKSPLDQMQVGKTVDGNNETDDEEEEIDLDAVSVSN